jgi:hypothetical protein
VSTACATQGSGASPIQTAPPEERLVTASQGLCDALGLADQGDVPGAAKAFYDRVHAFLHELARRLETFDRETAGDLLVAKQKVEAALAEPGSADPQEVSELIQELRGELGTAAEAAGLPTPTCTGGSD